MLCPNCGKEVGERPGPCRTCLQASSLANYPTMSAVRAAKKTTENSQLSYSLSTSKNFARNRFGNPFVLVLCMIAAAIIMTVLMYVLVGMDDAYFSDGLGRGGVAEGESSPDSRGQVMPFTNAVIGLVHGQLFRVDNSVFNKNDNKLVLRQGRGKIADLEVEIVLPKSISPRAGLVLEINSSSYDNVYPQLFIRWKESSGRQEVLKYTSPYDYSLSLRFTALSKDRISGVVSASASDRQGTKFSGSFEAAWNE